VYSGDDAGVDASAKKFETVAGEAGEQLDVLSFRGAECGDSVGGQVALIVEGSGIAEVAG
jgi:hypothetical protein